MPLQVINRGIRQMMIGRWDEENVWIDQHLIRGARNMSVELQVETDELRGDDVVLDRYTKIISALVNVEMATLDLTAYSMFTGGSLDSDDYYEDLVIGEDDDPPYLGLAARIVNSGSAGDTQILVPKSRIAGNLSLLAQVGTYMLPGGQFQAVSEGEVNGIARIRNYRQKTALEMPLRNTVGGFA